MNLREAAEKMGMKPVAGLSRLSQEFHRGYVSDLFSAVMAKAGKVWITLQVPWNIVAVAALKGMAAIRKWTSPMSTAKTRGLFPGYPADQVRSGGTFP
jgi:hypothetical protein